MSEAVKQCSVLIVNCDRGKLRTVKRLRAEGFLVVETREWPDDEMVRRYEVVIVVLRQMETIGMLAARMRAKPRFGHRVLIGVSPENSNRRRAPKRNRRGL